MKHISTQIIGFTGLAMVSLLSLVGFMSISQKPNELSEAEMADIFGGIPGRKCDSATPSCPKAAECHPYGLGGSIFYYNNGKRACGPALFQQCDDGQSAECYSKVHNGTTCTDPVGEMNSEGAYPYCNLE